MEAIEDPRYGRVRSVAPPPPAQDYRNYVTQQYETPYEQVKNYICTILVNVIKNLEKFLIRVETSVISVFDPI